MGVPIIRTIVFGGLYWGPPYLGKLPTRQHKAIADKLATWNPRPLAKKKRSASSVPLSKLNIKTHKVVGFGVQGVGWIFQKNGDMRVRSTTLSAS